MGRSDGFNIIHHQPEAIAHVDHAYINGRAGGGIEYQPHGVGLAANSQRVDFTAGFAGCVRLAKKQLRYKAALHPILFKLLPETFTIPQLQNLYECVYETLFDNWNFTRKIMSTGLLIKLNGKDKSGSRKGAFYYKLDKRTYKVKEEAFLNFVAKPDKFI